MTTRMKIFLRLKAQEIGIALAVIAVLIGIGFGFYKLSNAYSQWIDAESYGISKINYFLVNPLTFTLESFITDNIDSDYRISNSFYKYTTNSLFFQSLWTLLQWAIFLGLGSLIPAAIVSLIIDWIKANWHKAGILAGDIEVKKRKRKSK